MTAEDRKKEFEKELKELLKKYSAELEIEEVQCGYYGNDSQICVTFNGYKDEKDEWHDWCELKLGRWINGGEKK